MISPAAAMSTALGVPSQSISQLAWKNATAGSFYITESAALATGDIAYSLSSSAPPLVTVSSVLRFSSAALPCFYWHMIHCSFVGMLIACWMAFADPVQSVATSGVSTARSAPMPTARVGVLQTAPHTSATCALWTACLC